MNKQLVAALGSHGQAAVGLSGGDGLIFRARKKRTTPDLGFVGEIVASDTRWLDAIWNMGAVPVISSLALGFDGEYYNINADEMASACAVACKADALVFPDGLFQACVVRMVEVMRWLSVDQIGRPDAGRGDQRWHAAETRRLPRSAAGWRETCADSTCGCGIRIA